LRREAMNVGLPEAIGVGKGTVRSPRSLQY